MRAQPAKRPAKVRLCMKESEEQVCLFQWTEYAKYKYPELALLHHIPNGGKRDAITAAIMKREGVKAGVSDLFLPVARHGYHGLYIELKALDGKLSSNQKWWIEETAKQGYKSMTCWGWEEAKSEIVSYLEA